MSILNPRLIALAVLGLGLAGFDLWLGLAHGTVSGPVVWSGCAVGLAYVATGVTAWALRPRSRIGLWMTVMGIVALMAFASTGVRPPTDLPGRAILTLVGTPALWLQFAVGTHLFLTYPSGRAENRTERVLTGTTFATATVASVLTLLTKTAVPACAGWCGPSPLAMIHEPDLYLWLRSVFLVVLVVLAGLGWLVLLRGYLGAGPRRRRSQRFRLGLATATLLILATGILGLLAYYTGTESAEGLVDHMGLVIGWASVAGLPFGFLFGLLRDRWAFADLGSLVGRAQNANPEVVERGLARAVRDPELRVAYASADGWRDVLGRPYHPPADDSRSRTEIGEPPVALLVHDPDLRAEPALLAAATAVLRLTATSVPAAGPVPDRHVFISYVREDSAAVDRLATALRGHGIEVWLDRTHLVPGDRWADRIRQAIGAGANFVACFSAASSRRDRTYMNEELILAIEELRLRPRDRRWFLPVVLDGSPVPDHPIGAGETLRSLHHVDLSEGWEAGVLRVAHAISTP
ncbi:toll/interleukin-1 receptor domain-containing protein [Plantactinospora sp. S1510]|uniref:Toll/interleukin-1 receptor domain-containing protein n=1 Tax=Plantactinospora alkalitolerans TaxID=2789879 RepID=A0ABS0GN36_9ACTN|nr:toll/interleukin-1 receptor domain-containing protein [Plantactinospora alkalitolerans]MBF9127607.1 toll/interleukin-1 receptor domain-containing protein [Plantactinospora alkalitolerans]